MSRFFAAVACICGGLLSACASYTPSSAPVTNPDSTDWVRVGDLAVAADPYTDTERQKSTFDADFNKADVIAILVVAKNEGPRKRLVRFSDMMLALPNGDQFSPSGVTTVVNKVGESGSVVGSALAFGLIGALVASSKEDQARTARTADYREKSFKDTTISNGESAQGFVFFIPPRGTEPFDTATLKVRFVDFDTASSEVVKVPLTGLAYEETKEKKDEEE